MANEMDRRVEWTMGEVVGDALRLLVDNKGLVLAHCALMACIYVPATIWGGTLAAMLARVTTGGGGDGSQLALAGVALGAVFVIPGILLVCAMLYPSLLGMYVRAARGARPAFGELFQRPFWRTGSIVTVGVLTGLAVLGGMLLLLVPGIILIFSLMLAPNLLVEEEPMGVTEAMSASRRLMKGHKLHYCGMGLLVGLACMLLGIPWSLSPWLLPLSIMWNIAQMAIGMALTATLYARLRPLPTQSEPLVLVDAAALG